MTSPQHWYHQGFSAFQKGQPIEANPHQEGTTRWEGWRKGWQAGQDFKLSPQQTNPVDGPSVEETALVDAHVEEIHRVGATLLNLGRGITENSIESETDQGILITERIGDGMYAHHWPKALGEA